MTIAHKTKTIKPIKQHSALKTASFDSPLGPMIAIADDKGLYLLEFDERRGLTRELENLRKVKGDIISGMNDPILFIQNELKRYFSGKLTEFKTPFHILGTPFQQQVWNALIQIPYGETKSYLEQAKVIKKPTAFRAVANANGRNQLAILIPCHRIINSNGNLGGYGGGLHRKQWLLDHEKRIKG